jgi:RNA polymerase sigma-70 factor (ECF subfamily)
LKFEPSRLIVWTMSSADRDMEDIYAVAEGDRAALAALYDRHSSLLLGLAMRILRQRRDAEDVLHDVFLEVWRCAGDYDPERGSVAAWLRLRMRSRALDRVRSAGYQRSRALDDETAAILADPEAHMESSPDSSAVHRALETLPSDQRVVLMLGYFEGLSSSEIAEREGLPLGTVKSRVAAALAKLRAQLGAAQGEAL